MEGDEKIGYHKGAIESLINERNELGRLLQIVNSLIEKHAIELKDEGVDIEKYIEEVSENSKKKAESMQERSGEGRNPRDRGRNNRKPGSGSEKGPKRKSGPSRGSRNRSSGKGGKSGKRKRPGRSPRKSSRGSEGGRSSRRPRKRSSRRDEGSSSEDDVEIEDWLED